MPDNESWQLTAEEAALVNRYLSFYRALDTGRRVPTTDAQRRFVDVCRCEANAESPHEIAYIKYRMLIKKHRNEDARFEHDIDEFGEGVPQLGWFTDEGWKRMRGQYLSNSD
jgi:uncharacterized protein YifE (UPF0438 family)